MDNISRYGFRWAQHWPGQGSMPQTVARIVASAASFDPSGGTANCKLGPGDVVNEVDDGTVFFCQGTENGQTPRLAWGVVVGVKQYWDVTIGQHGALRVSPNYLPSDITWGTNLSRASIVLCIPITAGVWEVDVDENTTATTRAAYLDMVGENVDLINTNSPSDRLNPKLDISSNATSNALAFRIVGISPIVENQDFSGTGVKLLVRANLASDPAHSATGV